MPDTDSLTAVLPPETEDALAVIAREQLGFPTLQTQNSDGLDFRDCAVWCVKEALRKAYLLGRESTAA